MNYEWKCPDCGKETGGCTTCNYEFGDEIECCWCGRVSRITNIVSVLYVEQTKKKVAPTELEKLEALKCGYND